jgi:serine protease
MRVARLLAIFIAISVLVLGACRLQEEPPPADFTLWASQASLALAPGELGAVSLEIARAATPAATARAPVALLVADVPEDLVVSFSPNPVYGRASTLMVQVAPGAAPRRYEVTLVARGGGAERRVPLELAVGARADDGGSRITGTLTTVNTEIPIQAGASSPGEALTGLAGESLPGAEVYAQGELLVRYRSAPGELSAQALESYRLTARAVARDFGLQLVQSGDPGRPDLVRVAPGDLEGALGRLSRDPRVLYAEPNYFLYTQELPSDPRLREQWALASAGVPVAWSAQDGSAPDGGPVVAVIDSGFDLLHEDLAGRFLGGYDFCANADCSLTDDDPGFGDPGNFHGTHVAGIIGAIGDNGVGIAGVVEGPGLGLLPVKIFNDRGGGATASTFIDGIRWAVGLPVTTRDGKRVQNPSPARVVNLSLGGYIENSQAMQEAVTQARRAGAVVVAASGNNGIEALMMPAAAEGAIAVGAINRSFRRACFSNFGAGLDIVAPGGEGGPSSPMARQPLPNPDCAPPGERLLSTVPTSATDPPYGQAAGTSMATPMVAGVAALLLGQQPKLTVAEVEARLLGTAYFDGGYMTKSEYGAGMLRADRALGLPGPGDAVAVRGTGPSDRSGVAVLDPYGRSSLFELNHLQAGSYVVRAGGPAQLSAEGGLSLGENEREILNLRLRYQRR